MATMLTLSQFTRSTIFKRKRDESGLFGIVQGKSSTSLDGCRWIVRATTSEAAKSEAYHDQYRYVIEHPLPE